MAEETNDNDIDVSEGIETDAIVGAENPQHVHSWSRMNVFNTCPFLYKATYLDKLVGEISNIMVIGRVVHEAIALYNQHCLKLKISSDHEKWKEFADIAIRKENLSSEFYEEVFSMIKEYADSHEIDLESAIGAEEKIAINRKGEIVDWTAPDVWFRGIVDFLQLQGYIAKITDYKAGYGMKTDPFQMEIYAWLIKKAYPQVTDFQVEIDYVRHAYQQDFTLTEDDLAGIEDKILSRISHIEKETKFEPKVGIACSYCSMWYACPAMQQASKVGDLRVRVPSTEADAAVIATELEKFSRLAAERKKVLKEYCDRAGDLRTGGRWYGFRVSSSYDFSIHEMVVALNELGIDLLEYLNVDGRKFKKLLQDEAISTIVKKLEKKKVSVTFASKKDDGKKEEEVE